MLRRKFLETLCAAPFVALFCFISDDLATKATQQPKSQQPWKILDAKGQCVAIVRNDCPVCWGIDYTVEKCGVRLGSP